MFKGAAKTDTEMATQIQPRSWIRIELFTRKRVRIRIKENSPTFIPTKSFIADICSKKETKETIIRIIS